MLQRLASLDYLVMKQEVGVHWGKWWEYGKSWNLMAYSSRLKLTWKLKSDGVSEQVEIDLKAKTWWGIRAGWNWPENWDPMGCLSRSKLTWKLKPDGVFEQVEIDLKAETWWVFERVEIDLKAETWWDIRAGWNWPESWKLMACSSR